MALKLKELQDLKKFPFINVDKFTGNEGNCTLVDETSGDKNCYMVNTEMQVQVDQNLEATFSLNITLHLTIANEIITKITVANVDVKGVSGMSESSKMPYIFIFFAATHRFSFTVQHQRTLF